MAKNRLEEAMNVWDSLAPEQREAISNENRREEKSAIVRLQHDLERMVLVANLYHGLRELAPEDVEKWRSVCLAMCSQDDTTQEFVNMAADMALKPECMKN